jgi:nucleoside-diphosphate-sugar epimerase
VIHAAGRLFGREREGYFRANVEGSVRLAAQLPEHTRMIALSSLAAGGPTPLSAKARTVEHEDEPISFYGASKLAMEKELRKMLGKRLLLLRPPMVLGPRDTATVPLFHMAKGWVRVKPGMRSKQYSWIAVDDLCTALLTAATASWEGTKFLQPFYLTAAQLITDKELLAGTAYALRCRGVTLPVPQVMITWASLLIDAVPAWRDAVPSLGRDRVCEMLPQCWVADGKPFAELFSWRPRRNLEETLHATVEWLESCSQV